MTPFDRVEELRSQLNLSQSHFLERIQATRSAYSNWKNGSQLPGRDNLIAMADRWFVTIDSLWARPGTRSIEPSADLGIAQERLVARLATNQTAAGSPTQRIISCYTHLTLETPSGSPLLPTLDSEAWAEWLKWSLEDWNACLRQELEAGPAQIEGAAFFLGWYDHHKAWSEWFRTGLTSALLGPAKMSWEKVASLASNVGLDSVDLRRLIYAHSLAK